MVGKGSRHAGPIAKKKPELQTQHAPNQQAPERDWTFSVTAAVVGALVASAGLLTGIVSPPHNIWISAFGIAAIFVGLSTGLHQYWSRWKLVNATLTVLLILGDAYLAYQWTKDYWASQPPQQAYVSLGRKDGVVAEWITSANPDAPVGITLYFHNSGPVAATNFNAGTMGDWYILPFERLRKSLTLKSHHYFVPLVRSKDRKTGEVQGGIGDTIAPDSVFPIDMAELTKNWVDELDQSKEVFMAFGQFEYCAANGVHVCQGFHLYYTALPYRAFRGTQEKCLMPLTIPKSTKTLEYSDPCSEQ